MNKAIQLLSGIRILEVANSPINGRLVAVKDYAWGTHIQANGLTQSGGVAEYIWKFTLKQLRKKKPKIENSLILGLGGGSIAKIIRKNWFDAKIIGVDIDSKIVQMGKDYMSLDKYSVEIHITDAFLFCENSKQKFDLICIDTYQGDQFPDEFSSDEFLKNIKKMMSKDGVAIYNRLYYGEKRKEAMKMLPKLEKIFNSVDPIYPEANVMFVCKN